MPRRCCRRRTPCYRQSRARAVASFAAALAPGAPLVDESLPSNLVSHQSFTAGDPARRFAEADRIV
jgi:carbon-monoxide dehydrogenase large subunit